MVRVIACMLVLLVACEPDTADTAFRCDTDLGGHRGCPEAQSCVSGRCRRGGAVGEVQCGLDDCTTAQQCCVDGKNAARCIAAGDVCPGPAALCDERADCASGDYCCNGDTTACGASCGEAACLDVVDCPSETPNCCFGKGGDTSIEVPWGHCSAAPCP